MNNLPEKKFRAGAVSATVWQNQGKDRFGNDVSYRTVSFDRRYKDKNGVWQSTNSLRVNDLPKALLVINEAYKYLLLKEGYEKSDNKIDDEGSQQIESEMDDVI